jgi:hypothetical protein
MPQRKAFLSLLAALACNAVLARADSGASPNWRTGDGFRQQLAAKLDITWSGIPLRTALERLSKTQQVAIVLDRRVDPGQIVELTQNGATTESILRSLADKEQLGISILEPLVYLGPTSTAQRLRTLAALRKEEVGRLPTNVQAAFMKPRAWRWDDLTTPKELLGQLGSESGIAIAGLEEIPHDLWAGADLPPLSWIDRLTLVAAQFDKTFSIAADGKSVRLVPAPAEVTMRRTYAPGGVTPDILASRLSAAAPRAKVSMAGNKLTVDAPAEDQDLIAALLDKRAAKRPAEPEGKKVHTLRVKDVPTRRLLTELARRLDWDLHLNEQAIREAGLSLDALVSVDVKNVTADELLRAACEPAGLQFRREGNAVEIEPARR